MVAHLAEKFKDLNFRFFAFWLHFGLTVDPTRFARQVLHRGANQFRCFPGRMGQNMYFYI